MKIGIFAPSSACRSDLYQAALMQAEGLGHTIVVAHDPSLNYGSKRYLFSSDSTESRINAFESLLANDHIEAIIAVRGGYGSVDLLSELTSLKSKLIANPSGRSVYLSGISDVTALLLGLDGIPHIKLVHGPGFIDAFSSYNQISGRKLSTDCLMDLLQSKWSGYRNLSLTEISGTTSGAQPVRGKLLGGNLSVIASLVGSSYLPDFADRILFLEEVGEKPYRVHRALRQLKLAGLLGNLRAVLLGNFDRCVHEKGAGPNLDEVLEDIFTGSRYPIYKGFPAGHAELNLALPMGVDVQISRTEILPL